MKQNLHKAIIILLLSCLTGFTVYLALRLHNNSVKDKKYKLDYFLVNQIKYGMLSGDNWSNQVNAIINMQVDSFTFSGENKKVLTAQIGAVLSRVMDEADAVLHKKQKKLTDRIKFKVINSVVDMDKFKAEIPRFSRAIIDELDKSKNKEQIKNLLKEKVNGILAITDQDTLGEQRSVLARYGRMDIKMFNKQMAYYAAEIKAEQQQLAYMLIGVLVAVLLLWIYIIKAKVIYGLSFMFAVVISCLSLFVGVSLPMIEIDARIGKLDLGILSSHIIFEDQVIFFQTKSIIDVIHILLTNGKVDTIFVGVLIFTFSVLFPVFKLISATIYLFIKEKSNAFIKYMAFKSGKWSMADVMVVAIFMAFVGFQGILNDQLSDIELHTDDVNLITTNKSNLQPGFLIFVSFVIFNLVLAEILKRITKKDECDN